MKNQILILTISIFLVCGQWSCNSNKEKSKCEGPLITKADSLSCDTSRCSSLCTGPFRTREDSLACVTYCKNSPPVISTQYGYFDLTFDGTFYHFPGILTQNADGWKYGAALTNGVVGSGFALQGDVMKQNPTIAKFQFHFNYDAISGPGTYIIPKMDDAFPFRFVTANSNPSGAAVPDFTGDASLYDMAMNATRVKSGSDCNETEHPVASQTLVITKWANAGQIVEGTITGTLYENIKTSLNCKDSKVMPYTGSFKIRRIM